MSRKHFGPPPPYQAHRHPRPHRPHRPTSVVYVPTPIVMPIYSTPQPQPPPPPEPQPSQPTYVTNYHVYQPAPNPAPVPAPVRPPVVTPVSPVAPIVVQGNSIDWISATGPTASSLASKALVCGKEGWDGSPLWVIRAHHGGDLVPGKLAIKHKSAFIPHAGKEIPVHNFEVLCAPQQSVHWVPSTNGKIPVGAVIGGNTSKGEPLYVGRARYQGSTTPGKVHPSHGCLYISFGGQEIPQKIYEVLCKII